MNSYHFSEDKFSEAQFFLHLMIKNTDRVPDFRYYFSAFLSAARSVASVWAKAADISTASADNPEYNICERLGNLYKEYFIKDPLLEFLVDARNHTIHEGNLPLKISDQRFIGEVKTELGQHRWSFSNYPSTLLYENNVVELSKKVLDKICQYLLDVRDCIEDIT